MSVFRVEKTRDYTVMANYHLRDKALSMKAKGLLSLMLSLPDDWDFTTKGLASICGADGLHSVRTTLTELEEHGYLVRTRIRNAKGHLTSTQYTVYEKSRKDAGADEAEPEFVEAEPDAGKDSTGFQPKCGFQTLDGEGQENPDNNSKNMKEQETESIGAVENREALPETLPSFQPKCGFPMLDNPTLEKPTLENQTQLSTYSPSTDLPSTDPPLSPPAAWQGNAPPGLCAAPSKEEAQKQVIQKSIHYHKLCEEFDTKLVDLAVRVILDTLLLRGKKIRLGGGFMPLPAVQQRMQELRYQHALEASQRSKKPIKNWQQYLLTVLYTAPSFPCNKATGPGGKLGAKPGKNTALYNEIINQPLDIPGESTDSNTAARQFMHSEHWK